MYSFCTWYQNLRKYTHIYKEEIMLSCSIQKFCFLSFYPDIYILFLQHLYIENRNSQHSRTNHYSIIIWTGVGVGEGTYWVYWTVCMASLWANPWHGSGVSSVTLENRHRTTKSTNIVSAFLIHWRSCFIAELNIWQYTLFFFSIKKYLGK